MEWKWIFDAGKSWIYYFVDGRWRWLGNELLWVDCKVYCKDWVNSDDTEYFNSQLLEAAWDCRTRTMSRYQTWLTISFYGRKFEEVYHEKFR